MPKETINVNYNWNGPPQRRYGCFSFILDLFLIFLTCGLWLIWIIIREARR